jgi:hypothetical protein
MNYKLDGKERGMRDEEVEWDAGEKAGASQATTDQHGCEKVKKCKGRKEGGWRKGRGGEEDMKRQEPTGKGKQGNVVISTSKFPSQRMSLPAL